MKVKTERQLNESYNRVSPYLKDQSVTKELREMCKCCEMYCGDDHDYGECRNKMCFTFWLAYTYLEWCNSYGGI